MKISKVVAERSTCNRAQVGCVLVRDKHILSTGYNASPSKIAHCDDSGHIMRSTHCVATVHAEANAIIQCALHGISTKDATVYVTHFPCLSCIKMLINACIFKIVYDNEYRIDEIALTMLAECGIIVERIEL